jgi:hypothetical protein
MGNRRPGFQLLFRGIGYSQGPERIRGRWRATCAWRPAVRIWDRGLVTPMMVTTTDRSGSSFLKSQGWDAETMVQDVGTVGRSARPDRV